jgi:hypothetical protein
VDGNASVDAFCYKSVLLAAIERLLERSAPHAENGEGAGPESGVKRIHLLSEVIQWAAQDRLLPPQALGTTLEFSGDRFKRIIRVFQWPYPLIADHLRHDLVDDCVAELGLSREVVEMAPLVTPTRLRMLSMAAPWKPCR